MVLLESLYVLSVALLAIYGYNALILAWLRTRLSKSETGNPAVNPELQEWPQVTVQLPIYNERHVAKRLIAAIGKFDYPHNRLQIQVLDDSTDETQHIVERAVLQLQNKGLDIEHIRRSKRTGYKGGALEHGLASAKGKYIAIFDADFYPATDFFKKVVPHLEDDPMIGCLQTRWGHLNQDYSRLTRAQAIGIDGHFIVEQEVRSAKGLFLNFNGTAGVWRKRCIQDAGGWHHDTLTEDLDLSYRAQLRGWNIQFMPDVIAPAEIPVHISAYKRQQFRWAKGSIQTARKLLGKLWRSHYSTAIKLEGTIHLTNYIVHPLILLNLLLTLPLIHSQSPLLWFTPVFTFAALGPLSMYWVAMEHEKRKPLERIWKLSILLLLGMGISFNNSRAVLEALIGKQSSFLRTPKFNIKGKRSVFSTSEYLLPMDSNTWVELMLALYTLGLLVYVVANGVWSLVIWIFLYTSGYSLIASLNIRQHMNAVKG